MATPLSSPALSSRRSPQNHPRLQPLRRQIPIVGQALTAFPRVPSSQAFGRRPSVRLHASTTRRHPKPFTEAEAHTLGLTAAFRLQEGMRQPAGDRKPSIMSCRPEFPKIAAVSERRPIKSPPPNPSLRRFPERGSDSASERMRVSRKEVRGFFALMRAINGTAVYLPAVQTEAHQR